MRSPALQFVVAGALVVAWAWMLGRPLLANLLRRSRRDSIGHFRYQQAVLGQPEGIPKSRWWSLRELPHPVHAWRSQQLERRRLQMLLAFAIATFVSLLMAIALRGTFVRLFVLMAGCYVVYLAVATYIGSVQIRHQDAQDRVRQRGVEAESGRSVTVASPAVAPDDSVGVFVEDEIDHLAVDGRVFDDDFFEPIPELIFEPLHLEGEQLDPSEALADLLDLEDEIEEPIETFTESAESFEYTASSDASDARRNQEPDELVQDIEEAESQQELVSEQESDAPFKTSPAERERAARRTARRNKARPIYIESQLDEETGSPKAVND